MINYDNTKDNILNQMELNKSELDNISSTYEVKSKTLLECLKNINSIVQSSDEIKDPTKITTILYELKSNIDNLKKSMEVLNSLQVELVQLMDILENSYDEKISNSLAEKIENYNTQYSAFKSSNLYTEPVELEKLVLEYVKNSNFALNSYLESDFEDSNINSNYLVIEHSTHDNTDNSIQNLNIITDNNTLLISEIQNKVVLPYKITDLKEKLAKNKNYNNMQEIIDTEYTFALSKYKYGSISRFKEAYRLMRKKEKASVPDSLNLAIEVTFKSLLNPAIIAACNSLNELDIYLDCLEKNQLDKFSCFRVKYELFPTIA